VKAKVEGRRKEMLRKIVVDIDDLDFLIAYAEARIREDGDYLDNSKRLREIITKLRKQIFV